MGNNVLRQFLDAGFVQLSQVIDKDTVEGFVEQIRDELASTSKVEKERSIGCVVLADKSTWPQGKKRRVVECAPAGVGAHWEKLKSASKGHASFDYSAFENLGLTTSIWSFLRFLE